MQDDMYVGRYAGHGIGNDMTTMDHGKHETRPVSRALRRYTTKSSMFYTAEFIQAAAVASVHVGWLSSQWPSPD